MKKIFGEEALQMLPGQNGFIFVTKQEEHDGKTVVNYKMMDLERMTFAPVTRGVYLLAKFGNLFEQFEGRAEEFLSAQTLLLPEGRLLVTAPDGATKVFHGDGRILWRGDLCYLGEPPYDMVMGEGGFYASYPTAGAVIFYATGPIKPILRLGGGATPLPQPEGLYYEHGMLLVCSPKEQKILQLDPRHFTVEDYHTLPRPVHRFLKYHSHEVVLLDDGVYKL